MALKPKFLVLVCPVVVPGFVLHLHFDIQAHSGLCRAKSYLGKDVSSSAMDLLQPFLKGVELSAHWTVVEFFNSITVDGELISLEKTILTVSSNLDDIVNYRSLYSNMSESQSTCVKFLCRFLSARCFEK